MDDDDLNTNAAKPILQILNVRLQNNSSVQFTTHLTNKLRRDFDCREFNKLYPEDQLIAVCPLESRLDSDLYRVKRAVGKRSNPPTRSHNSQYRTPRQSLLPKRNKKQEQLLSDISALSPIKNPAILFIGPTRAGKSSFINSCLSVSVSTKDKIKTKEKSNNTLNHTPYTLGKFKLIDPDCEIFEPVDGKGLHPGDIVNLLQGHLKDDYKFDPMKQITTDNPSYRENPKYDNKSFCVVFVVDASTLNRDIPEKYVEKLDKLKDELTQTNIPRVLILTKVDNICDKVRDDVGTVFKSLRIQKAMEMASLAFSINMGSIHPVINFTTEEFKRSVARQIPILIALRQILSYACDREEYVQNTESDSVDDSG